MGRLLAAALVAGSLVLPGTAEAGLTPRARVVAAAPSAVSSVPLATSLAVPDEDTTLTVFADALGDAGAAPDLGATSVWSDADGLVTLRAEAPGAPALRDGDLYVLFLDTDLDAATGNRAAGGADALVLVSGATQTAGLARWTGIRWSFAVAHDVAQRARGTRGPPSSSRGRSSAAPRRSASGRARPTGPTDGAFATDVAPDSGMWRHDLGLAGPATGPGVIPDVTGPSVAALPSAGRRGGPVRLRYRVSDDSGLTRERIDIFRSGRRVAILRTPFAPSGPGVVFWATWRLPVKAAGRWTFCVRAWDPVGHTSPRRCAPLRVR